MPSKIVARIVRDSGIPGLFELLSARLSSSDLQSLLIEVYQARASALDPVAIMRSGERPLTLPATVDARILNEFDRAAFEAAEEFEAVDLSPVSAFGLSRILGAIDQNSVLSALRNTEVSGDPTTALALECARRRRLGKTVRLCASQRVIRMQPFDHPDYSPYFRLFCLVSAGRDTGSHAVELDHLREHIACYLRLFHILNTRGFSLQRPLVEVSDPALTKALLAENGVSPEELRPIIRAHRLGASARFLTDRGIDMPSTVNNHRLGLVQKNVFDVLALQFPEAQFSFNFARLEGLDYYSGLTLRISPVAPDGIRYPIIDGGFTDWTGRLLQNRKERFMASGVGSQFACLRYRP